MLRYGTQNQQDKWISFVTVEYSYNRSIFFYQNIFCSSVHVCLYRYLCYHLCIYLNSFVWIKRGSKKKTASMLQICAMLFKVSSAVKKRQPPYSKYVQCCSKLAWQSKKDSLCVFIHVNSYLFAWLLTYY